MFRQNRTLYISTFVLVVAAAGLAVNLAPGIVVASRNENAKTPEGKTEGHEAVTLSADEARRAGIKVERIEPAEQAGIVAAVGTIGPIATASHA
jgi:hypothetical protein